MNLYQKRKKFKKLAAKLPSRYGSVMEGDKPLADKVKAFEELRQPTKAEKAYKLV